MAVNLTALQVMQDAPVIPVIVLHDVAHAVPLARALVAGGIRMLEVTLRTPVALACIEAMARDVPEAIVGAGTVRSAADAQATVLAGARFAVSPGYTDEVDVACTVGIGDREVDIERRGVDAAIVAAKRQLAQHRQDRRCAGVGVVISPFIRNLSPVHHPSLLLRPRPAGLGQT